jgi:hypothetical protein
VGPALLGLARRAGAGPVRALPSGPWPAAPEAARRGPTTAPGGTALGASASPGARPRAPLRRHNRAVAAASVGASPRWHHPCAGGCRPLCTGPTPPATAAWPAAPHGRAAADAGPSAAAAGPRLHHGDGTRLVGRRGAGGGDRRGYGGLVARRHAPPADPLGPRPRSARAVRALSPAVHRSEGQARPAAGVVGAALAPGSALTGGPGSSGPGDATAMARVGHGPHPHVLVGLCSRVTLWAGPLAQEDTRPVRPAVL